MSARLYTMPAPAGWPEPTLLWLGELRILRTEQGWQIARPNGAGGLTALCSAMSLASALAAARAAQGGRG